MKTLVGIAFGPLWVNVNITKNKKMFSRRYYLKMRCYYQSWYLAVLFGNPGWDGILTPWDTGSFLLKIETWFSVKNEI
jgi:hypothetical protein